MPDASSLHSLIAHACRYRGQEPDVALALEICEAVKKRTSLASKSMDLLQPYLVSESPQECILALFVLDALVVNCGYPVHLALSKRDFLNKLVYRFPPNPQHDLDQTHHLTLQLLQKWCIALCEKSKHKGDFGNIRLMHSLLKSRGFPLPRIDPAEINAIIGHEREDALKTKEELLEEQRIVHEAKLEDLLKKGTPADLKAANELMQVMSGYVSTTVVETETTYSSADSQVASKLSLLEEKRQLLETMLWNTDPSQYASNDSIQALVEELERASLKLERLALGDLPEALLDRAITLAEAIHVLLSRVRRADSPTHQEDFSLLKFEDGSTDNPSAPTQPVFLGEGDPSIAKLATLHGPNVIAEVYQIADTIKLMLFNYSTNLMQDIRLVMDEREVELGSIDAMKGAAIELALLKRPSMARIKYRDLERGEAEAVLKLL